MEKEITIIIPTFNRKELLIKTLQALNKQDYPLKKIEVLVIDDCSSDSPKKEVLKLRTDYSLKFFCMAKNSGQGLVRNFAIKKASGRVIFFIGDDTIPDKNFIKEHMGLHDRTPGIAVLGKVKWHDEVKNDFMDFIEGIQFHYSNIKDKDNVKLHFYTSNISLEKKWFTDEEYSKEFKNYGFEDIEIGYRLEKKGLRVVYNPRALVYHYHEYDFPQFCERMRKVGLSAVIFSKLHPELKKNYIPNMIKLYKFGSSVLSHKIIQHISPKLYWYSNFVNHYIKGVEEQSKNVAR